MNDGFKELVYYSLCESLYDNMRKFTNYTTFINMCSNIKNYINSDFPIPGELNIVIKSTTSYVSYLYGIKEEETKEYLIYFLDNDVYLRYHKIVSVIKANCKNSNHC